MKIITKERFMYWEKVQTIFEMNEKGLIMRIRDEKGRKRRVKEQKSDLGLYSLILIIEMKSSNYKIYFTLSPRGICFPNRQLLLNWYPLSFYFVLCVRFYFYLENYIYVYHVLKKIFLQDFMSINHTFENNNLYIISHYIVCKWLDFGTKWSK